MDVYSKNHKEPYKNKLWSFLLHAPILHDVDASDTRLALTYKEIGNFGYVLPDRLLLLWLQKLVFNY